MWPLQHLSFSCPSLRFLVCLLWWFSYVFFSSLKWVFGKLRAVWIWMVGLDPYIFLLSFLLLVFVSLFFSKWDILVSWELFENEWKSLVSYICLPLRKHRHLDLTDFPLKNILCSQSTSLSHYCKYYWLTNYKVFLYFCRDITLIKRCYLYPTF